MAKIDNKKKKVKLLTKEDLKSRGGVVNSPGTNFWRACLVKDPPPTATSSVPKKKSSK